MYRRQANAVAARRSPNSEGSDGEVQARNDGVSESAVVRSIDGKLLHGGGTDARMRPPRPHTHVCGTPGLYRHSSRSTRVWCALSSSVIVTALPGGRCRCASSWSRLGPLCAMTAGRGSTPKFAVSSQLETLVSPFPAVSWHAVSLRPPPAYRRRQAHDRLHPGLAMHRLRQDRGAAAVHRGMPGPQDPDGRQGRPRTRARCRARASGSLPAARCRLAPASCWPRWRRSPSSRPATEGIPFPAPVGRSWWERLQSRCSSAQLKSIATEVAPTGYAPTNENR